MQDSTLQPDEITMFSTAYNSCTFSALCAKCVDNPHFMTEGSAVFLCLGIQLQSEIYSTQESHIPTPPGQRVTAPAKSRFHLAPKYCTVSKWPAMISSIVFAIHGVLYPSEHILRSTLIVRLPVFDLPVQYMQRYELPSRWRQPA